MTVDLDSLRLSLLQAQTWSQLHEDRKRLLFDAMIGLHGLIKRALDAGLHVHLDCQTEIGCADAQRFLDGMYPKALPALRRAGLETDSVPLHWFRVKWAHVCPTRME